MQFYSIIQKGELFGQDVINVYWYRRQSVGLPQQSDLTPVRLAWTTNVWSAVQPVLTSDYALRQIIVQGYDEQWNRVPYLPEIFEPSNTAGQAAPPTAAPLVCAVLSCRVSPVVPGPQMKDGVRVLRPVRRGYWAISGLPRDAFTTAGLMSEPYRVSAPVANWAALASTGFAASSAAEFLEPIRVSQPLPDEVTRGYGLITQCVWRKETSSRRSRKVGRGS